MNHLTLEAREFRAKLFADLGKTLVGSVVLGLSIGGASLWAVESGPFWGIFGITALVGVFGVFFVLSAIGETNEVSRLRTGQQLIARSVDGKA